jgi:hypothetical protein
MALPAPRAFARRMQLCPVLEYIAAVQALGGFNDKSDRRSYTLLNMGEMEKDLLDGHVQFHGQLLQGECPF